MHQLDKLMRWFGPEDPVTLDFIAQTGCAGVVSALHMIPVGDIWELNDIEFYKAVIREYDLTWTVVESLPVHEDIKRGAGDFKIYIENYKTSIKNLARVGIKVVTYNFMPVFDWLRTDLKYQEANGTETLRFDWDEYAMVDLFLLRRPGSNQEYSDKEIDRLFKKYNSLNQEKKDIILENILLGLPGTKTPFTIEQVLEQMEGYKNIDEFNLRQNLIYFLKQITPVAESVGVQLAIHPDDPPFSVFGLPRIMKTTEDIKEILYAVPSRSNGLCFCTGSFGARPDNDLLQMIKDWGSRIYFLHLRNTYRDHNSNFMESNHLEGDTDMFPLIQEIVLLMKRENRSIPMRPDHGKKMLDDIPKKVYPGYSLIGRLKGMAELSGLEFAIQKQIENEI
jgi:mannonate dehydratase